MASLDGLGSEAPDIGSARLKRLRSLARPFLLPLIMTAVIVVWPLGHMTKGTVSGAEKEEFQLRKQTEIRQVKPQKPVRIKLHRTAKGEYTWDLTGDSVDEIVTADKKLRKLLKIE